MTNTRAKLIILGIEKETKKSHIISKFIVSNGGKYEDKPTMIQSTNIQTTNDAQHKHPLTFEISPINVSHTYNLTKNHKSSHDKQIKALYNSADLIFLIYNVCNKKSFANAQKYYKQYQENRANMLRTPIIVLIGHKLNSYTQFNRDIQTSKGQQYASEHNSFFFEVSTTDNSIQSVFDNIGKLFLEKKSTKKSPNLSPKIMRMMSIPPSVTALENIENDSGNDLSEQKQMSESEYKIQALNEKISDYESIVYSLEHTLSMHEKDKKQLFDSNISYESKCIEFNLDIDSKTRTIHRQNDEINALIAEVRNKTDEIEALKNINNTRSKPKAPPRKSSSNVSEEQFIIKEKPIRTRARSHTAKEHSKNDSNIFGNLTKSLKISNIFAPKSDSNTNDEKEKETQQIITKCAKLETINRMLRQKNGSKTAELSALKQSNIDIMSQLSRKQKEIKHLRICLEDNQNGFTKYKEESEQTLEKWSAEKKYWFEKYKNISKENQKLIEEKRKLQRENRKLEKSKNKYKAQVMSGVTVQMSEKCKSISELEDKDIITMDRVTVHSLRSKTLAGFSNDQSCWNIPQLLRNFKTLKTNYYNNLIEKIMEFEDENESEIDSEEMVICVLFETVIECHSLIENINDSISVNIIFDRIEKYKNTVFEAIQNRNSDKFKQWFDDKEGSELMNEFRKYVQMCLEMCILIRHFKLRLFPMSSNKLKFEVKNILDYGAILQRDATFDGSEIECQWYCSFPSVVSKENELTEQQMLDIINQKTVEEYNIFQTKIWMYHSE